MRDQFGLDDGGGTLNADAGIFTFLPVSVSAGGIDRRMSLSFFGGGCGGVPEQPTNPPANANNGLTDQHLTFVESESLGLNSADDYTQTWDYFTALAQLHQQFPDSHKVFEVKPGLAVANMELVMARLA